MTEGPAATQQPGQWTCRLQHDSVCLHAALCLQPQILHACSRLLLVMRVQNRRSAVSAPQTRVSTLSLSQLAS